ncbi:four helix bundle protein [Pedobacter lithocola]|uniref:Four helix bundle protein n=1 Tax=Pedobacter lithocola TaxID=1908239 RepID=A0ABV8PF16_9SPHI
MAYQKYTELEVWKRARAFTALIYKLTVAFPKEEAYGLTSQIRRCAVSIPSNIAEGSGRRHAKETIQFLAISRESLYELETQIYVSFDIGFISELQLTECINEIETLGKLINGYIRFLLKE